MKKSLSKLAILATLAVLSSNAMAYKIYEDKSDDYHIKYIGDCNDDSTFSIWKTKDEHDWWGYHSKKTYKPLTQTMLTPPFANFVMNSFSNFTFLFK